MHSTLTPIRTARVAFDGATPFSRDYGDSYFMPGHGADEACAVFVEASDLPGRFASLPPDGVFTLGETGFGTGLNLLLAARCFLDHAPVSARLSLLSCELHPLEARDLARALAHWPELSGLATALLAEYPPPTPGWHRLELAPNIDLTLMYGDASVVWPEAEASIDAWFLDGFAPARNPGMWPTGLFEALAERSRPGATLATFTAAGGVRRGLTAAGFEVRRHAGFGAKRHRLTATRPGAWVPARASRGHAVIAGAGLAGATTARALAERGWRVTVCDPAGIAAGASGNRTGVVYSTPSAHLTPQNRFYQSALVQALRRLRRLEFPATPDDGCLNGVIQLATSPRHRDKLAQARESGAWPDAMLARLDEDRFVLRGAGYIRPGRWCCRLLDHPAIECLETAITGFEHGQPPTVALSNGRQLSPEALILCTADATARLPGLDWLPLRFSRGQVSHVAATPESRAWQQAICYAGYLTPAIDGVHCVGATFDRGAEQASCHPDDDRDNLARLQKHLPDCYAGLGGAGARVVGQRAGIRCQAPDFLPLAGPLPDPNPNPHQLRPGVWLNLGHGSRGITHTPLIADLIADELTGLARPCDRALREALAPERFIMRWRRRDRGWKPG